MGNRRWHRVLMAMGICVLCAPVARPAGLVAPGGLKGEYFDNLWYGEPPVVTRIDPEINFNWGNDPPAPGVSSNSFAVRWTGDLEVPVTAVYTFIIRANGSVKLRIAGKEIINRSSTLQTVTEVKGTLELGAGQAHRLEMT